MIRKIIQIDEEKCNGCGACAAACHEAAIQMVAGKARLVKDDYCDGLGDCLPHCPTDAIAIVEREAAAYDEAAVKARQQGKTLPFAGCPGSRARSLQRKVIRPAEGERAVVQKEKSCSALRQWPVQIKLAPVKAPYFSGAKLLIAADCSAYAYASFHEEFIRDHVVLIGCPKLDAVDYAEKLTQILQSNDLLSVQVVRMEVPCCGGLEHAVKTALENSGKWIPWQVVTISCTGEIIDRT